MREIKEIERRFLMKKLPNVNWDKIYEICQYYIKDGDLTKRLRRKSDVTGSESINNSYEYLHKIQKGVGEFIEVHEEVDADKYRELAPTAFKVVLKDRYVHIANGLHFEVDKINGVNLVIMEVELENINQEIVFPPIIEEQIIMEVTGIRELSNANLATLLK